RPGAAKAVAQAFEGVWLTTRHSRDLLRLAHELFPPTIADKSGEERHDPLSRLRAYSPAVARRGRRHGVAAGGTGHRPRTGRALEGGRPAAAVRRPGRHRAGLLARRRDRAIPFEGSAA